MRNRCNSVPALTFEQPLQVVDLAVPGRQRVRMREPVRSLLIAALTQRQDAPVRPCCGLPGRQQNRFCQPCLRTHIISHLERRQTRVVRSGEAVVGLCRWLRQAVSAPAATDPKQAREHQAREHRACKYRADRRHAEVASPSVLLQQVDHA